MNLRSQLSAGLALSIGLLALTGQAQTVRATTLGTVSGTMPSTSRLAAGLQVSVKITQSLSSKAAAEGDEWDGVLAKDLIVGGHLVTPSGTQVTGIVSKAVSASRAQGDGTLALRLTSIHGTGVTSTPVLRVGVNPALTSSGNIAAAGIPGEASQATATTSAAAAASPGGVGPAGAPQNGQALAEARILAGSIMNFTTE